MKNIYLHKVRWFLAKYDKLIGFILWILTLIMVGYIAYIIGELK